jgi:hypothetical protein
VGRVLVVRTSTSFSQKLAANGPRRFFAKLPKPDPAWWPWRMLLSWRMQTECRPLSNVWPRTTRTGASCFRIDLKELCGATYHTKKEVGWLLLHGCTVQYVLYSTRVKDICTPATIPATLSNQTATKVCWIVVYWIHMTPLCMDDDTNHL